MTTGLSLDQLASLASQHSGLPVAFTKALIAEEGTYQSGHNNPFDVTDAWARLAGYGANVTGVFGTQGNIAIFDDESAAIAAWANGLATFSNYAQFRADKAAGASAYQLALDLQNAGYAGGDGGYATKIATLTQQFGGTAGAAPSAPFTARAQPLILVGAGLLLLFVLRNHGG